jgi:hypothetical protein
MAASDVLCLSPAWSSCGLSRNSRSRVFPLPGSDAISIVTRRAVVKPANSITCDRPGVQCFFPKQADVRLGNAARAIERRLPQRARPVSAKLCFTLGVGYHMIIPLGVSSPLCFPYGKVGIMDSDLSHLKRSSAGYVRVAILLIHLTEEGAAC